MASAAITAKYSEDFQQSYFCKAHPQYIVYTANTTTTICADRQIQKSETEALRRTNTRERRIVSLHAVAFLI